MDASETVKHPRTLAAVRVVLSVLVAALVLALVVVGFSILGLGLVLAGVSLVVTGDPNLYGFGAFALLGLLGAGGLSLLAVVGARHVDHRIRAADRRPDPVAETKRAYVVGDIDERTLERRLERALGGVEPSPTRRARLRGLFVAFGQFPGRLRSSVSNAGFVDRPSDPSRSPRRSHPHASRPVRSRSRARTRK